MPKASAYRSSQPLHTATTVRSMTAQVHLAEGDAAVADDAAHVVPPQPKRRRQPPGHLDPGRGLLQRRHRIRSRPEADRADSLDGVEVALFVHPQPMNGEGPVVAAERGPAALQRSCAGAGSARTARRASRQGMSVDLERPATKRW